MKREFFEEIDRVEEIDSIESVDSVEYRHQTAALKATAAFLIENRRRVWYNLATI